MVQEFQIGGTSGSVALWTRASSDLRLALMYPLISRRIVALVVAYALALAPVLPLLGAFARAGDLDSADRGALCAGKQVGARSAADIPNEHGPLCSFGVGCSAQGCGADGVLLTAQAVVEVLAFGAAPSLLDFQGGSPLLRAGGAHSARAPPRA